MGNQYKSSEEIKKSVNKKEVTLFTMHESRKQYLSFVLKTSAWNRRNFFSKPSEIADYNILHNIVGEENYFLRDCYSRHCD